MVVIHHADASESARDTEWMPFEEFLKIGRERKLGRTSEGEVEWAQLPFDWPLWILFSSGTTGVCYWTHEFAFVLTEIDFLADVMCRTTEVSRFIADPPCGVALHCGPMLIQRLSFISTDRSSTAQEVCSSNPRKSS